MHFASPGQGHDITWYPWLIWRDEKWRHAQAHVLAVTSELSVHKGFFSCLHLLLVWSLKNIGSSLTISPFLQWWNAVNGEEPFSRKWASTVLNWPNRSWGKCAYINWIVEFWNIVMYIKVICNSDIRCYLSTYWSNWYICSWMIMYNGWNASCGTRAPPCSSICQSRTKFIRTQIFVRWSIPVIFIRVVLVVSSY